MRTKLTSIIALVVLMFALLPSTTLAAQDATRPCSNGSNNYLRYLWKSVSNYVDEFTADAVVQDLYPCTGGAGGTPSVLPVNIQHSGSGFAAQLGYERSWRTNGALDWIWTPDTCSSPVGLVDRATGFPDPIIGHRYQLKIIYVTSSSRWRAYIDDYADGLGNPTGQWFDDGECRVNGNAVWAGFEVGDSGDSLGGSVWTEIEQLYYQEWNDTTNIYMTDGTNYGANGFPMSYWNSQVYNDPSPRDAIRAYTNPS